MEMLLDKKQIQAIFWFEFKMGRKAAEKACSISYAFHLGTAKDIQCSGGSSSAKETRVLKLRSTVATGSWQRQLRAIIEDDPFTTTWEVVAEFNINHRWCYGLQMFGIWSKLESLKSSITECLMSWPEI